jgi:hypothetical protein
MKRDNTEDARFELVLSDGKLRKFNTGEEMYNFTKIARKNWKYETKEDEERNKQNG